MYYVLKFKSYYYYYYSPNTYFLSAGAQAYPHVVWDPTYLLYIEFKNFWQLPDFDSSAHLHFTAPLGSTSASYTASFGPLIFE